MSAIAAGVCRETSRPHIENAYLIPEVRAEDDGNPIMKYRDFIPPEGKREASLTIARGSLNENVSAGETCLLISQISVACLM